MTERTEEDALEIARAAFDCLEARDWPGLRSFVDPAALDSINRQAIVVARSTATPRASSPEEIQSRQPGMPRAVAEWFSQEEARALASEEPAGIKSLGVASVEELQALAAGEVFVRWMNATDKSERLFRATGHVHVPPRKRYTLVGVVIEGAAAHVLYRVEGFMHGAQVETLRGTDDGWRLSVDGVVSRALRTHFRVGPRVAQPPP